MKIKILYLAWEHLEGACYTSAIFPIPLQNPPAEALQNEYTFVNVGCTKPNVCACSAWRGIISKQFSTNCLYLLKTVPFKILSPP